MKWWFCKHIWTTISAHDIVMKVGRIGPYTVITQQCIVCGKCQQRELTGHLTSTLQAIRANILREETINENR